MSAKNGKTKKSKATKRQELKIVPDYESTFPTAYAQYAIITHTPDDICIDFCQIAQPYKIIGKDKSLKVPVVSRVIIPPSMAEGLINALKAQYEKQLKAKDSREMNIGVIKGVEGEEK